MRKGWRQQFPGVASPGRAEAELHSWGPQGKEPAGASAEIGAWYRVDVLCPHFLGSTPLDFSLSMVVCGAEPSRSGLELLCCQRVEGAAMPGPLKTQPLPKGHPHRSQMVLQPPERAQPFSDTISTKQGGAAPAHSQGLTTTSQGPFCHTGCKQRSGVSELSPSWGGKE